MICPAKGTHVHICAIGLQVERGESSNVAIRSLPRAGENPNPSSLADQDGDGCWRWYQDFRTAAVSWTARGVWRVPVEWECGGESSCASKRLRPRPPLRFL
jgi:hypothetical protein